MEEKSKNRIVPEPEVLRQRRFMEAVRELHRGEGPYFYIQTFGCQQNEADSERIAGMLREMGYTRTESPGQADLIIVNTCAIREHAELKALSITGQFKHLKVAKPSLTIAMCGCLVSLEGRGEDIKSRYPYVDILFGVSRLWSLPEILYDSLMSGKRRFLPDDCDGETAEGLPVERESSFMAWVSIMSGCNNFCSYCVVPYVRGRERSRDKPKILDEVRELAGRGYKEITLLGQNVNSYAGASDGAAFPGLLADICKIEGDFLVRFMTSHPKDATERLFDVMAANPKIAKQLHLPVQSGSSRVLTAMNRGYTRERYLKLIGYARSVMPEIALSTDIIVGFPGETEDEFEETLSLLSEVRYDSIFSFIYSRRPGTRAADFPEQLPEEVKSERFARLLETQNAISLEKNRELVGRTLRVLVEGRSKTDASRLTGRTEGGRLVHFEGDDRLVGSYAELEITEAETYALMGALSI